MVREARRNAGQSVIVEVQLSQVGDVSHCAIFHKADLIVAQAKPAGKISRKKGIRMNLHLLCGHYFPSLFLNHKQMENKCSPLPISSPK